MQSREFMLTVHLKGLYASYRFHNLKGFIADELEFFFQEPVSKIQQKIKKTQKSGYTKSETNSKRNI